MATESRARLGTGGEKAATVVSDDDARSIEGTFLVLTPAAAPTRPRLRVVATETSAEGWVPASLISSLSVHAFRPGEIPTLVRVHLDLETRAVMVASAARDGLPCQLWLRIAVEAARCVGDVATALGYTDRRVETLCDQQALQARASARVVPMAMATLGGYANLLERGERSGKLSREPIEIFLSDEMYGAWSAEAATHGETLDRWIASMIPRAPTQCVRWETAAARSSKTLAEWLYASALRAAASSTA